MRKTRLRDFNPAYLAACQALERGMADNFDTSALNVLMDEVARQQDIANARAAFVEANRIGPRCRSLSP